MDTLQVTSIDRMGRIAIRESDAREQNVHRRVLVPGRFIAANTWIDTDLGSEPDMIKALAPSIWTTEVVARYKQANPWVEPAGPSEQDVRSRAFRDDQNTKDLIDRLRTATPTQIGNYVDNNITSLANAKVLLKQIVMVLGYIVRE